MARLETIFRRVLHSVPIFAVLVWALVNWSAILLAVGIAVVILGSVFLVAIPFALQSQLIDIRCAERKERGLCLECGYDRRASKGRCPECGAVLRGRVWARKSAKQCSKLTVDFSNPVLDAPSKRCR